MEKKADCVGALGPKEQHSSEFPGFSFYHICLRLQASNPETPTGGDKKKKKVPTKACTLAKEPGKWQLFSKKLFDNNCSNLVTHHNKNYALSLPMPTKAKWEA